MPRTSYSRLVNKVGLGLYPLFAAILVWIGYEFTYTFQPANPLIPFLCMGLAGGFVRQAFVAFDAL
jgi:hypothetical protein